MRFEQGQDQGHIGSAIASRTPNTLAIADMRFEIFPR